MAILLQYRAASARYVGRIAVPRTKLKNRLSVWLRLYDTNHIINNSIKYVHNVGKFALKPSVFSQPKIDPLVTHIATRCLQQRIKQVLELQWTNQKACSCVIWHYVSYNFDSSPDPVIDHDTHSIQPAISTLNHTVQCLYYYTILLSETVLGPHIFYSSPDPGIDHELHISSSQPFLLWTILSMSLLQCCAAETLWP